MTDAEAQEKIEAVHALLNKATQLLERVMKEQKQSSQQKPTNGTVKSLNTTQPT